MNKRVFSASKKTLIIISTMFISVIIILCIMIYNLQNSYNEAKNDVLALNRDNSLRCSKQIDTYLLRHSDVLLTSAQALEYILSNSDMTESDIESFLKSISISYSDGLYKKTFKKEFSGVYASINGVLLHGMKSKTDLKQGYDPTIRPWYIEACQNKGSIVFGEPYIDIYNDKIIDVTASKLLNDGTTVIAMDLTTEDMQSVINDIDISVDINGDNRLYGYGFVLTKNGKVLCHSKEKGEVNKDYSKLQSPMYQVFNSISSSTNKQFFDYIKLDNTNYGYFSYRLSNDWYYVNLVNLDNIETTASKTSLRLFALSSLILLFVLVFCGLITKAYISSDKMSGTLKKTLNMAMSDSLTGVFNRAAFDIKMKELSDLISSKNDESFALVMIDLNDLKFINDNYGHKEGDIYINNCCRFIMDVFPCDLFRVGGDEFSIILRNELFDRWEELFDKIKLLAHKANNRLTPNVNEPSIAIGVAVHIVGTDDTINAIMRKADSEMYANKASIKKSRLENSKKGSAFDIKSELIDKQILVSEMQKGLEEEQFEVWFQPQIDHETKKIVGSEALVRWIHPTKGMISPAVFIPLLEYNGLIYELDKYVWRHVCSCIKEWINDRIKMPPVSVNVSQLDILQPDFLDVINSLVDKQNIPHELIHLEITESAFLDDDKVEKIVNNLHERGFIIAIDDFGSGYSSLSLLRNINANIVKLDMRFFSSESNNTKNECIITSIVNMIKNLKMGLIAEGVEKTEQADMLSRIGCTCIQGFLYSKPLPYEEYLDYYRKSIEK